MKLKSIQEIKEIIDTKILKRINRNVFLYLMFVGISTVFWFLNELSNEYTTTINYPVKFINLPENKVLVSDLPKKLKLNVKSYGYTLFRYKLSPASFPVIINIRQYANNLSDSSVNNYELQTRYLHETINNQLQNDIEVIEILPATIMFHFAKMISKRVAVKPNVTLTFDDQCMLNGEITFKPDSITIKGPNTLLDTLDAVYTEYKEFNKLSEPLEKSISLEKKTKLKFNKKKVLIKLPVSKFTQASFQIPIQSNNVPDTLELKTFPRMIKVTCLIALDDYDKVNAKDFMVEVDYTDVEKLLGNKLSLKLGVTPKNVKSVTFYPQSVEFLLDKKP